MMTTRGIKSSSTGGHFLQLKRCCCYECNDDKNTKVIHTRERLRRGSGRRQQRKRGGVSIIRAAKATSQIQTTGEEREDSSEDDSDGEKRKGDTKNTIEIVSPFQDVADAMLRKGTARSEEENEEEENRRYPRLTKETVDEALEEIRPYVINDGGNIEVVAVSEEDGIVAVRLLGACASCASSQATMKGGVESALRKTFGEKAIKEVINVSGDVGQAPPELTKEAVGAHLKSIEDRVKGYGGVVKCLEVDGRKGNVVLGFRGPKPLAAATAQSLQKTFPFIKTASLKELDDDDDDDD
jgi:Fe-S cluster biogenesis protein NfuA